MPDPSLFVERTAVVGRLCTLRPKRRRALAELCEVGEGVAGELQTTAYPAKLAWSRLARPSHAQQSCIAARTEVPLTCHRGRASRPWGILSRGPARRSTMKTVLGL